MKKSKKVREKTVNCIYFFLGNCMNPERKTSFLWLVRTCLLKDEIGFCGECLKRISHEEMEKAKENIGERRKQLFPNRSE